MTLSTTRPSTTRSLAAVAAVAAASTLAACGSSQDNASSASAPTSVASSAPTSSSSSASSTTEAQAKKTQDNRASRSNERTAITESTTTKGEDVAPLTTYRYSADLPKGTQKVTREGKPGHITLTFKTKKQGDKVISTERTNVKIDKYAVRKIVTIGTGDAASTSASSTTQTTPKVSRSTTRTAVSTGGSPNAAMWNSIASCESGNNWSINTGNGFYGGLQFTQQTWAGYGGLAYAPRADLASAGQQMAIADKVLADVGRGAWPVCGRR